MTPTQPAAIPPYSDVLLFLLYFYSSFLFSSHWLPSTFFPLHFLLLIISCFLLLFLSAYIFCFLGFITQRLPLRAILHVLLSVLISLFHFLCFLFPARSCHQSLPSVSPSLLSCQRLTSNQLTASLAHFCLSSSPSHANESPHSYFIPSSPSSSSFESPHAPLIGYSKLYPSHSNSHAPTHTSPHSLRRTSRHIHTHPHSNLHPPSLPYILPYPYSDYPSHYDSSILTSFLYLQHQQV